MGNTNVQYMQVVHHGRNIDGMLYEPKEEKKYPIVIFCHGYNGHKTDFESTATYLTEHGIGAFTFTFCGGSTRDESGMPTTQMTIFTEIEDLQAVISFVKNLEQVDTKKIFVFGGSQGGLVTALTADEMSDEIRGMILLYPAFCIAENWNQRFPNIEDIPEVEELWDMKLGRVFFESIHGYDVYAHIGQYRNPILVMHGDEDLIVDQAFSEKLTKCYQKIRLEVFEGEGHGFSPEGTKRMTKMLYDFVKENI